MSVLQGTVKFFHDEKQYGFIETDEVDDDIFFHISDVEGEEVGEGDEVEFEQEEGDRGPKAVEIEIVE
ncbi:MAG: cold shock domain-containing protein [Candidatus Nanohaloarchaea archaeon]